MYICPSPVSWLKILHLISQTWNFQPITLKKFSIAFRDESSCMFYFDKGGNLKCQIFKSPLSYHTLMEIFLCEPYVHTMQIIFKIWSGFWSLKNFQIGSKDVSAIMKWTRGFYWVLCSVETTNLMLLLDAKRTGAEGVCFNWCKLWFFCIFSFSYLLENFELTSRVILHRYGNLKIKFYLFFSL